MPYTINGCGTKYYGRRDQESDGSYITTEWIVFLFLPLMPIGSYRVQLLKSALMSSEYHIWKVPLQWRQILNVYLADALLLGLLTGGCSMIENDTNRYSSTPDNPISLATDKSGSSITPQPSPSYVRPKTADNGQPFPATSGYIKKYPKKATDGYSSITIKNDENDSDVFVKVFAKNTGKPIRTFFIRAHESFTAKEITPGKYDVRYRDLNSGGFSKTDEFELVEKKDKDGSKYSVITMTLYKVSGGNMQTQSIDPASFE
jgi:hypothetical protein